MTPVLTDPSTRRGTPRSLLNFAFVAVARWIPSIVVEVCRKVAREHDGSIIAK